MGDNLTKKHIPTTVFIRRLLGHILFGALVILASLGLGMLGYRHFEGMSWVDAYVNASMILSGMGPVKNLETDAGKVFAGTYAMFSGIVFLVVIAMIFTPVIHRFFMKIHMEDSKSSK